ncbi:hypothetical protein NEIG_00295 [Nematocida sp. ERTm5]|nr:hypothetical protein NEIRO02_1031 [Nematocida sp. AWRm79]KAI5183162.1 hypothetical protein NEIRO03_0784 [Nematocida sp. AWRm78]OAG30811.1 hypothetical protein NEIG_00295 [Nematocida sp. ERTm5]
MFLEYFCSLILWYNKNGLDSLFISKLGNILKNSSEELSLSDKTVICFNCKKVNIPVVNCTVRVNKNEFFVTCTKCRETTKFPIGSVYKNVYVRGSYDIDAFLAGV